MFTLFAVRKANFRLLVSVLLAAPLLAAARPALPGARQQINAQAIEVAEKAIADLAQRAGWRDYRYTLNVLMPGNVATLPACSQPLRLSAAPLQLKTFARQNYRVACQSGTPWQSAVTVKTDLYLPVVMAGREVARGEVITPDALVMKRYNVANLRGEPLLSLEEATGLTAKRTLRPWKPILRTQLEQPLLVKRGETVTVISQTGDIRAQTAGVALKDGRLQQIIKVQNSSSERVIDAVVAGPGEVRVGAQ